MTGSGTQVKLSDGSVVPLSRVRFANGELGRVYALAGRYDTTSAGAFVVGYDGSLPVEIYQAGFDAVHRLAAQGMSRDSALANAGAAARLLPDDAKKLAYNTGNLLFEENGGKIIQEEIKPGDSDLMVEQGENEFVPDKPKDTVQSNEDITQGYESDLKVRDSKFLDVDGNIDWDTWAPNGGRVPGTIQEGQILETGTIIDRYGSEYGKYTSPIGVPYEQRALPYIENLNAYHQYKVLKPIDNVTISKIAEAFEQPGGGMQYELPSTIHQLIQDNFLEEIIK